MIFSAHERMLWQLAETHRRQATSDRHGTVAEVKQEGGEQKIRVEIGVDPNGKPLIGPWMSTVDKRGATREQHQYQKGQNVRISGDDYRQATVSGWSEGKSFPQPDNAPEHGYGDSYQAGKLHTGSWMPQEEEGQGGGGAGPQGGGGGGGGQGGQDKNHRHEVWIAKEDNKPPKHTGKSREETRSIDSSQHQQQKDEQGKEKKIEEAIMVSTDEKNGFTARVGKEVRVAAHPEGAKTRAGKSYYSAKKDDDVVMHGEKDTYNRTEENFYYAAMKGSPFINKPWVIKFEKKDDEVKNDDQLGNGQKSKPQGGKQGGK